MFRFSIPDTSFSVLFLDEPWLAVESDLLFGSSAASFKQGLLEGNLILVLKSFQVYQIGVGMVLEALVQGSKVHLDELRLRMSKTLFSTSSIQNSRLCDSAKLALCLASDLQQRSRATLESLIGTKENGHTASCVLSSDFQSQLAWGVASSHRVGKAWTFFTRFSKDDYAGERLIFQVVHELDAVNKFSTIFATTIGHHPQAGFSWLHEASNKGEVRRSLSLKGLVSGDGNFS
ncbi:hypothetical protein GOP47_0004203, partial [Adiantum capillus-veneris]